MFVKRGGKFSIPFLIEQRIDSAETPAGGGAALWDNERVRKKETGLQTG